MYQILKHTPESTEQLLSCMVFFSHGLSPPAGEIVGKMLEEMLAGWKKEKKSF